MMEIGVGTFGENPANSSSGNNFRGRRRMMELLEEVTLADEVGLDVFAFGEHHRPDFVISSPEIVMAAAAARTKDIRLSSVVTLLSSADPIRIFQDFASIDLISTGRAEIIAGRGAFPESFPLFGYDAADTEALFDEHLELLMAVNQDEAASGNGRPMSAAGGLGVYPRPYQTTLPVWRAVSRTPASVIKAAEHGMPIAISMFGGKPQQFMPLVNLYRQTTQKAGVHAGKGQIAIATQFYVHDNAEMAIKEYYSSFERLMNQIARERGLERVDREQFEMLRKSGPLVIGGVQEAIDKIMLFYELFGNTRYMAHIDAGNISHDRALKAIELLGTEIAPVIRRETAGRNI